MAHIRCMDLEAVNLSQVVEPVINYEGRISIGLDLSGPQAGAEEDTSSICWNIADYLEFCR
jgi:hypothetical protein